MTSAGWPRHARRVPGHRARNHDGDFGVVSTGAVVGQPQPPADPGIDLGPITQPDAVSVPGSHGSEIGCAADWDPPCDAIQLALGADQVWKGTFSPQAGQYAFKAAINRSWDENYGVEATATGRTSSTTPTAVRWASTTTTAPTG